MLEVGQFQGQQYGYNTGHNGNSCHSRLDNLFGLRSPSFGQNQAWCGPQMMSPQAMMFNMMSLFMMCEMMSNIPNFGSCPQACRGNEFGMPQPGWAFPGQGSMYNSGAHQSHSAQQTPWTPPRYSGGRVRASRPQAMLPQQIRAQVAPPQFSGRSQASVPMAAPAQVAVKATPAPSYTKTRTKEYDPTQDAAALYDSMKGGLFGFGTNEKKMMASLKGKSAEQLQALKANYKDHYGRDLEKDVRGELSGKTESEAIALLDESTAPEKAAKTDAPKVKTESEKLADARSAAKTLGKAMNRLGTDEKAIFRALDGKSKEEIDAITKVYDAENKTGLSQKLTKELSGNDLERAQRLLKNGTLSDAARLKYATEGVGTDEATIKSVLKGKSKEEVQKIKSDYQNETGRNLDTDLKQELSGRDEFDATMDLKGKAENVSEALERANEKRDYERKGLGNFVSRNVMDTVSSKGKLLDKNTDRANLAHERYLQAQAEGRTADAQVEKERLEQVLGYADADVGHYRKAEDSAANTAGTVAATAASAAVVIGSGGTATPLVMAGWAGAAGAGAKVVTSAAVKGGSYGAGDLASDAGTGAVDGLAMVVGAGAGRAAKTALQASGKGALATSRTAAFAIEGAVDGLLAGGISSGTGTALRDGTWDEGLGTGLKRVGISTGVGAGLGTVAGAGMGAAIGVAPKVIKGSKKLAHEVATDTKKLAGKGRQIAGELRTDAGRVISGAGKNVRKAMDKVGAKGKKLATGLNDFAQPRTPSRILSGDKASAFWAKVKDLDPATRVRLTKAFQTGDAAGLSGKAKAIFGQFQDGGTGATKKFSGLIGFDDVAKPRASRFAKAKSALKRYDQFGKRTQKRAVDGTKNWWGGYTRGVKERAKQLGQLTDSHIAGPAKVKWDGYTRGVKERAKQLGQLTDSHVAGPAKAKWGDYLNWKSAKVHKVSETFKNGTARILNRPRVENGVTIPDAIFGPNEVIRHSGNVWNRGPSIPADQLKLH